MKRSTECRIVRDVPPTSQTLFAFGNPRITMSSHGFPPGLLQSKCYTGANGHCVVQPAMIRTLASHTTRRPIKFLVILS